VYQLFQAPSGHLMLPCCDHQPKRRGHSHQADSVLSLHSSDSASSTRSDQGVGFTVHNSQTNRFHRTRRDYSQEENDRLARIHNAAAPSGAAPPPANPQPAYLQDEYPGAHAEFWQARQLSERSGGDSGSDPSLQFSSNQLSADVSHSSEQVCESDEAE